MTSLMTCLPLHWLQVSSEPDFLIHISKGRGSRSIHFVYWSHHKFIFFLTPISTLIVHIFFALTYNLLGTMQCNNKEISLPSHSTPKWTSDSRTLTLIGTFPAISNYSIGWGDLRVTCIIMLESMGTTYCASFCLVISGQNSYLLM